MRNHTLRVLSIICASSFLLFACGDSSENGGSTGESCTNSDGCPTGWSCQNSVCVPDEDVTPKERPIPKSGAEDEPGKPDDGSGTKPPDPVKPEPVDPLNDTDGDTIPDTYDACDVDTDKDTVPNCRDLDSDGDTIPDAVEAGNGGDRSVEPADSDYDGEYDFLDLDSDSNGIPDEEEAGDDPLHPVDTDGDTVPDYIDEDNDGDSVADDLEIAGLVKDGHPGRKCDDTWCEPGTVLSPWDSDDDGIPDYNDPDSDNDTIPDAIEGDSDADGDGVLNRYSLDSDGDTIPDSQEVDAQGNPLYYVSQNTVRYCFMYADCDGDALPDANEQVCGSVVGVVTQDSDGDGFPDGAEYPAAQYAMEHGLLGGSTVTSLEDVVCNSAIGVTDVFEFYFELKWKGDSRSADLLFEPSVQKLDLVFNVDTTVSMSETIGNVKSNIQNTVQSIQGMVDDSGFGLTNFDDFPVGNYGDPSSGDLPYRVIGNVSTDPNVVKGYVNNSLFKTRAGTDTAESGVESLYQLATGKGESSWDGGSIPAHSNAANTWGGADFRNDSLPIVIHTTDAYSHDEDFLSYSSAVSKPHYSTETINALRDKGIRVITLGVPNSQNVQEADLYGQMTRWAKETDAIVPACAFADACGKNKCCLGSKITEPEYLNGKPNQCVLAYQALQADVSTTIVNGVDALIKYGTYEVAARVRGVPIEGSDKDTSCFIRKVEATTYIPPMQEPEHSCNPEAVPTIIGESDYNNGFRNFAPGTSSKSKKGAELHFTVNAQNPDCVKGGKEAQVFEAYIEVYNPTTGLSFGERKVSIIVPPEDAQGQIN
ncbi:MAG: hypothetical protein IJU23_12795 [Proteobacteria bacterium]|nr:hypothetical protein [Pseudomonadota bacterium]